MKVTSACMARFASVLCVSLIAQWQCAQAQSAVQITSPAPGAVLSPGQTVVVGVSVSGGPFTSVGIVAPGYMNDSLVLQSPPYEFSFTVPSQVTPGPTVIGAMGFTASGFAIGQISVDIERPDSPQSITIDHSQIELPIGAQLPVSVTGYFADGSIVDLSQSAQTTYRSQNPGVATVSADGVVIGVAAGSTQVIVDGNISVGVTVDPPISVVPAQATLAAWQTLYFSAPVSGLSNSAVTWSLSPGYGSVAANGVYTAPVAWAGWLR